MRRPLLLLVGAISLLILLAFEVPLALYVRDSAHQRAIASATAAAQDIAPVVATTDAAGLTAAMGDANARSPYPLTVFMPDGTVLGAPAAKSERVANAESGRSLTGPVPGGIEVLIAVGGIDRTGGEESAVVRAFVSNDQTRTGVARAWAVLAAVGLGLLAIALVVANALARGMVRPLRDTALLARELAAGDLTARLTPAGPKEIRHVTAALNLLAQRIGELLRAERESVADLSHRLRTPMTALRIDIESLTESADRQQLLAGLDELQRATDLLIAEARGPIRAPMPVSCDGAAVTRERVAYWAALAEDEGRPMTSQVTAAPVPVRLAAEDLAACVDALIGNVFAHTPSDAGCTVALGPAAAGGARLVVTDDGPGVADVAVLRRGVSAAGSSGLGLSIVARTAHAAGGYLHVASASSGGLAIEVEFGAPTEEFWAPVRRQDPPAAPEDPANGPADRRR